MSESAHILLVEDNAADVGLVREGIAASGRPVELHRCQDGAEALEFLRRQGEFAGAPRPDLILLDLNIPKKSGRDVLAVIKKDDALKTIPVVVLSTSSAELDVADCYGLHANAYVVKPLKLDAFIAAIRAIEAFWLDCAVLHGPSDQDEMLRRQRAEAKTAPAAPEAARGNGAPGAIDPAARSDGADTAEGAGGSDGTSGTDTAAGPAEVHAAPGGAARGNGKPDGDLPDVIVVEDDPSGAEMLEYALSNDGYAVAAYRDGNEALSALLALDAGDHKPVVLLDVDLPGTDGFKILRELNSARPDAYQVILCTVHQSEASQVLAFKSGAVDYLVKPLRFPVVLAKVRRFLEG